MLKIILSYTLIYQLTGLLSILFTMLIFYFYRIISKSDFMEWKDDFDIVSNHRLFYLMVFTEVISLFVMIPLSMMWLGWLKMDESSILILPLLSIGLFYFKFMGCRKYLYERNTNINAKENAIYKDNEL